MTTGTSGRGPERPLFTALASRSYDLPKGGTVARAARRRQRRRLESRQSPRLRPRVLRRSGPNSLPSCGPPARDCGIAGLGGCRRLTKPLSPRPNHPNSTPTREVGIVPTAYGGLQGTRWEGQVAGAKGPRRWPPKLRQPRFPGSLRESIKAGDRQAAGTPTRTEG